MIKDAFFLAWKLVSFRPLSFLLAVAGIAFAVLLVFVQYGFYHAIGDSQANMARYLNADLVAIDVNRSTLNKWDEFDRYWISKMAAVKGVRQVIPLYKGSMQWQAFPKAQTKRIIVMAFEPGSHALTLRPDPVADNALKIRGNFLFDGKARAIYGNIITGKDYLLDGQYYRLAKQVEIGPNLVNDGLVILSEGDWRARHTRARPIMALVRLENPQAVKALNALVQGNLLLLTPRQLFQREIDYTTQKAPVGLIFGMGMLTCLMIAALLAYQIVQQELQAQQKALFTLQAIGFGKAMLLCCVGFMITFYLFGGFVLALPFVELAYQLLAEKTAMVFYLSTDRVAFIAALILLLAVMLMIIRPRGE